VRSRSGDPARGMLFLRAFVPSCGFFVLNIFKVILGAHMLQTFYCWWFTCTFKDFENWQNFNLEIFPVSLYRLPDFVGIAAIKLSKDTERGGTDKKRDSSPTSPDSVVNHIFRGSCKTRTSINAKILTQNDLHVNSTYSNRVGEFTCKSFWVKRLVLIDVLVLQFPL